MKITMYYNQRAEGGKAVSEGWSLFAGKGNGVYGSHYPLDQKEIELPEGWTIGKTICGETAIFDKEGIYVDILGNRDSLVLLDGKGKIYKF